VVFGIVSHICFRHAVVSSLAEADPHEHCSGE
jgi:hypothetical protein